MGNSENFTLLQLYKQLHSSNAHICRWLVSVEEVYTVYCYKTSRVKNLPIDHIPVETWQYFNNIAAFCNILALLTIE